MRASGWVRWGRGAAARSSTRPGAGPHGRGGRVPAGAARPVRHGTAGPAPRRARVPPPGVRWHPLSGGEKLLPFPQERLHLPRAPPAFLHDARASWSLDARILKPAAQSQPSRWSRNERAIAETAQPRTRAMAAMPLEATSSHWRNRVPGKVAVEDAHRLGSVGNRPGPQPDGHEATIEARSEPRARRRFAATSAPHRRTMSIGDGTNSNRRRSRI